MACYRRPKVASIGCGRIISSFGTNSLDLVDYPHFGQKLELETIIARAPKLHQIADIVPIPFKAVSGTALDVTRLASNSRSCSSAFLIPT